MLWNSALWQIYFGNLLWIFLLKKSPSENIFFDTIVWTNRRTFYSLYSKSNSESWSHFWGSFKNTWDQIDNVTIYVDCLFWELGSWGAWHTSRGLNCINSRWYLGSARSRSVTNNWLFWEPGSWGGGVAAQWREASDQWLEVLLLHTGCFS